MLSYREMASLIASDELAAAGWRRRLTVQLHPVMCRYYPRYAAPLCAIGESVRRMLRRGDADPATLDRLERAILNPSPGKPVGKGRTVWIRGCNPPVSSSCFG